VKKKRINGVVRVNIVERDEQTEEGDGARYVLSVN